MELDHYDLEHDATIRAIRPDVMIDNQPELVVETIEAQYKIPKFASYDKKVIITMIK